MENSTENTTETSKVETEQENVIEQDLKTEEAEAQEGAADQEPEAPKEEKSEDFKEKYYYLAAEMQNMQRRFDKEKENLLKFGNEKLIRDILDVVDNLDRTLGFIKADEDPKVKNIVVGVEMIQKMFMESLGKYGVKLIEALGKEFDPHFHEALSQKPAEDKPNMEIIEVQQNGYMLNDRVIRAAKVVVVKND